MSDTLNPSAPKFGLPWYVVLGVITLSVGIFMIPHCKVFGLLLSPCVLGFGWWLCRNDPKEPHLVWFELLMPSEYDPGK